MGSGLEMTTKFLLSTKCEFVFMYVCICLYALQTHSQLKSAEDV